LLVNVCVVGSVVNKPSPASYELFPVCDDDHDADLRHRAWPSDQDEADTCVGEYSEHLYCVISKQVSVFKGTYKQSQCTVVRNVFIC